MFAVVRPSCEFSEIPARRTPSSKSRQQRNTPKSTDDLDHGQPDLDQPDHPAVV